MDKLPGIDTSNITMPPVKAPRRPTVADAYAQAHARAVRLAYAVAGAIEDYPMPVGTAPTGNHVLILECAADRLRDLLVDGFDCTEPPADLPEAH